MHKPFFQRVLFLIAMVLFSASYMAGSAQACECPVNVTEAQQRENADMVFLGLTRGGLYFNDGHYQQAIEVMMMEKNATGRTIPQGMRVMIAQPNDSCAVIFRPEEYFMIYAKRMDNGMTMTGQCSGTRRIKLESDPYR